MKRIITMVLALLLLPLPAHAAYAVEVKRISGVNRFETAVEIAKTSFDKAEHIVIASAEQPADAMTGGILSQAAKAPLLLVSKDQIDTSVRKAIADFAPKGIYVLGGPSTIGDEVVQALRTHAPVTRLYGENRYQTASAVEAEAIKLGCNADRAVYVNGKETVDSLIAGPLIAKRGGVMRLYDGKPVDSKYTVVGGESSIKSYNGKGRIAGRDRFETAINIAKSDFPKAKTAILVAEDKTADALAAISLSQAYDAPIYYTRNRVLPAGVKDYLKEAGVNRELIVGGEKSIDPFLEASVKNLHERANELGSIPILMYHHIDNRKDRYRRSPEEFYNDLDILYKEGYLPVLMTDYIRGEVDIPAGYKPYILTFDDGSDNNFRLLPDGTPDPKSAVGVIMEFAKDHPLFQPHASFFITGPVPFKVESEVEQKLKFLYENGMEIGNHSYTHRNFWILDEHGLQEEIGKENNALNSYQNLGRPINLLCLPYGQWPKPTYSDLLKHGRYDSVEYRFEGVIYTREKYAYSPFHTRFNPYEITRRGIGNPYGTTPQDILSYYNKNSSSKYVSDGDPSTVAIPGNWQDVLGALPKGKTLKIFPDLP